MTLWTGSKKKLAGPKSQQKRKKQQAPSFDVAFVHKYPVLHYHAFLTECHKPQPVYSIATQEKAENQEERKSHTEIFTVSWGERSNGHTHTPNYFESNTTG